MRAARLCVRARACMDGQVRTAFPAELLTDRERSLEELGLVPSATLLVRVTGGAGGPM